MQEKQIEGPGRQEDNKQQNNVNDDDDDCSDDDSSCDSDSSEDQGPVPGGDLLTQIFHLQSQDNAKALGISQKQTKKSKPLVKPAKAAKNQMSKTQRDMGPQKSLQKSAPAQANSKNLSMRQNEMDKLLQVVQLAFEAQILKDGRQSQNLETYMNENTQDVPDERLLTENFERMRSHFNCLKSLETSHGSLSDAERVREVLRQNSFLLGLEQNKNKGIQLQLTMQKRSTERMKKEKSELLNASKNLQSELQNFKKLTYDIDFDFY